MINIAKRNETYHEPFCLPFTQALDEPVARCKWEITKIFLISTLAFHWHRALTDDLPAFANWSISEACGHKVGCNVIWVNLSGALFSFRTLKFDRLYIGFGYIDLYIYSFHQTNGWLARSEKWIKKYYPPRLAYLRHKYFPKQPLWPKKIINCYFSLEFKTMLTKHQVTQVLSLDFKKGTCLF